VVNEVIVYTHTKWLQTNPSEVLYDGKLSCTLQMLIEDIQDIIDQCLE
jgi:hypothetical protein